jgi:hypothetical protein
VARFLEERKTLLRSGGKFVVGNPFLAIQFFSFFRGMGDVLLEKRKARLSPQALVERLPEECTLCLDSALQYFVPRFSSQRVCVYVKNWREAKKVLGAIEETRPGATQLWVFREDLPAKTVVVNGKKVTEKVRTVIDLACDNAVFAAHALFEELWQHKIL